MIRQVRVWGWAGATAVALLGLEAALAAVVRAQGRLVLAPGPASVDEVLGTLAAVVALLLGAWLAVSSTAAVLAHAPGRVGAASGRLAAACAPLLTRRVAAVLVGAAVGSALAPATALAQEATPFPGFSATADAAPVPPGTPVSPGRPGTPGTTPRSTPSGAAGPPPSFSPTSPASDPPSAASTAPATPAAALHGLSTAPTAAGNRAAAAPAAGWTPSRPLQRHVPAPDLVTSGGASGGRNEVVVHRGDTLWDLVAAHLGAGASDAEVAAAWPRWHAANRAVIGEDPDRLLPGQRLVVPSAEVAR